MRIDQAAGRTHAGDEVAQAAAAIVSDFGAHRTGDYFAGFAPDATFVFHTHPERLESRAAYEQLWSTWEAEGFRVEGCTSYEGQVHVLADTVAVFTHRVRTRLAGRPEPLEERETIVFRRDADRDWLAVHEHLSPVSAS
ncbi:MAG: nuclear transport factor 2 family protein [Nocardioides sp.]|nr:nuclear transport factor 2 family protein [Nocardioides sp.]